jgi:hypothetical protein
VEAFDKARNLVIKVFVSLDKPQNVVFFIRLGKKLHERLVEENNVPVLKHYTTREVTFVDYAGHRFFGHRVGQVQNILLFLEFLV